MIIGSDEVLSERELLKSVEGGMMMESIESVKYLVIHCTATHSSRDYTCKLLLKDHTICGHSQMPQAIRKACPSFDAEQEYGYLEK